MNKLTAIFLFFVLCLFVGCEKKDTSKIKPPDGTPIITVQPKGATYLEGDKMEALTIEASAPKGYELIYKWYITQKDDENVIYAEIPNYMISIKIPGNDKDSLFRQIGSVSSNSSRLSSETGTYICIVTSLSPDGERTFQTVSDPAVVTIIPNPLNSWFSADREPFSNYAWNSYTYMRLNDIAFGNGCFAVVGSRVGEPQGSLGPGNFGIIAYSDDGEKWNVIRDTIFYSYGNTINAVTYGNGRFVAVGSNGKTAYSTDAKTWTPAENILTDNLYQITFGNGCFIARSNSGLAYSSDGETWLAADNFSSSKVSYINFVNNHFIAADSEGKIYFSNDGKKWKMKKTDTFNSYSIITIAYGNGRYVAFAREYGEYDDSSSKIVFSDDGETWIEHYSTKNREDSIWIREIIYSEGYFVVVGADKTTFSKDGERWYNDLRSDDVYENWFVIKDVFNYSAVAYGNGKFVAVSDNSTIKYCQWPVTEEQAAGSASSVIADYK